MDEPQPNATPDNGAGAPAQPVEPVQAPAAQPVEPAQQQPQAPSEDDTAEWLSKKGFDPADPEFATKIAKSYREAEKLALAKAQEASELKKTLTPQATPAPQQGVDPNLAAVSEFAQEYKRDKQITAFKDAHEDWKEHEPTMVNLLQESITTPYGEFTRSQLVNMGMLTLNDVYAMAKGSAPVDTDEVKTQARQEVLQTLANTQRAGGANAHASSGTSSAPKYTKDNIDEWYPKLSAEERAKPEIQAIIAS